MIPLNAEGRWLLFFSRSPYARHICMLPKKLTMYFAKKKTTVAYPSIRNLVFQFPK